MGRKEPCSDTHAGPEANVALPEWTLLVPMLRTARTVSQAAGDAFTRMASGINPGCQVEHGK